MTRDTLATEICRDLKRQLQAKDEVIAVLAAACTVLAVLMIMPVAKERR